MKIEKISPAPPVIAVQSEPPLTLWDIWNRWKDAAFTGEGEQRDVAVRRLEACIENETSPLDLRELSLSALPPVLPANGKLTVSKNLLEALLRYIESNRSTERLVTDYIDNFLFYYFDCAFQHELEADNNKFLQTLFSDESTNLPEVATRVASAFSASREAIYANIREGLIAWFNYSICTLQCGNFSELQAELDILLHGEFCKTAYRCTFE